MTPSERPVVVAPVKSVGIGLLLTILFGPLGMLYCTIPGAIIMMILFAVIGFLTAGIGLIILWPVCIVWTVLAIQNYNRRLLSGKG
ncbi:hypothetical protein [Prosthecochloris sp. HL-130-GSB]|jgi:hypothetical protein|uniref:Uncharacterized protein n=1 Tax=Prosthecochloris aestuarii TaxID=1102 RepID=A0A831WVH7_PROAE|nr:hypothetical protein [Prosthecochloris sp. HL-130-GSB]ARM31292.1 hypothetical protein B9H02_08295 [Prosthecochloris sp. HL-130-GSB]MBO8093363.1 hypothetical protein [Prosthecochloris sp.]HED31179.1 hypothetical protein [Prosthecochloris aestuarii]